MHEGHVTHRQRQEDEVCNRGADEGSRTDDDLDSDQRGEEHDQWWDDIVTQQADIVQTLTVVGAYVHDLEGENASSMMTVGGTNIFH